MTSSSAAPATAPSTTATSSADPTSLLDGVDPSPLFEPASFAGLELQNHFAMAPMTRAFSPGGIPTDEVVEYYRRRAAHLGLIVTEGTYIDHPSAGLSDRIPLMTGEAPLEGWRKVVDAVHEKGAKIFPQIWHVGAVRPAGAPPHPDAPVTSPSGINGRGEPVGEPATLAEIDEIIASFARAAADAKRIGFDGVELHGAHGYLLDQFLWSVTNQRTDQYGGSLENRARLSAEVVAAVRDAVGPGFPIMFRYSQWKGSDFAAQIATTAAELETLLTPLVTAGLSAFHVSTRRYWLPAFPSEARTLAGWTKELTGLPVVALGSVGVSAPYRDTSGDVASSLSLAPLVDLFERGEFDLVALGRAILSEPEWPTKVRDGRLDEIRAYDKSHEAELY